MERILIAGGSGNVGKKLIPKLRMQGYEVAILTRVLPARNNTGVKYFEWQPRNNKIDESAIKWATVIINLAGAGIAESRWTAARKEELLKSRTQTANCLVEALLKIPNTVHSLISTSAIGYYGADKNPIMPFKETDSPGNDFLASICKAWESAISGLQNVKTYIFRIGLVMDKNSGVYEQFARPMRLGIATILSSGNQNYSWIHIDDLANLYIHFIRTKPAPGVYNAVSPAPITCKKMVEEMAKAKKGPVLKVTVPKLALELTLRAMATEVTKSATVSAEKLLKTGFQFQFPKFEDVANDFEK